MGDYSIYEFDNGDIRVSSLQGEPLDINEAKWIVEILQKYISENTQQEVNEKQREFFATVHPDMYEQIYREPLPAKYRKEKKVVVKKPKRTCVYLMFDNNTGFYKIGRSDSPPIRERTLQSQNPAIQLVFHTEGTPKYENELHNKYRDKRVRGEWFSLDETDVEDIISEFKEKAR